VTRATPAALATSSIVELPFVTRAGWQAFQQFATVEPACQQPEHAPNNGKMEALSFGATWCSSSAAC